jgi:hypothetical protein
MATKLTKPVVREVQHAGAPFKVVLSPSGLVVTQKGKRRGVTLTWEQILDAEDDRDGAPAPPAPRNGQAREDPITQKLGMSGPIAADVLLLMRQANESLSQATQLIDHASELPSLIANRREPRAPTERERSDWFIEPLLTVKEVAGVLGVSTQRVRGLPLKALNLDGQIRYHPAELRRYLAAQAEAGRPYHRMRL